RAVVVESKQVIYEGFVRAVGHDVPVSHAGILVDEEFGAPVLRAAAAAGYITALSVERSGSEEFQFEYGDAFRQHIEDFNPTFAKVLVRYNPDDQASMKRAQGMRLSELSTFCRESNRRLMFELLVPPTDNQLKSVDSDKGAYDTELRAGLISGKSRASRRATIVSGS